MAARKSVPGKKLPVGRGRKTPSPQPSPAKRARGTETSLRRRDANQQTAATILAVHSDRQLGTVPANTHRHLAAARTLLSCVAFTLDYASWRAEQGTDYALALSTIGDLLRQAMEVSESAER